MSTEHALLVGVVRESATGERRVALVPEVLGKLAALGARAIVEHGAGSKATFDDTQYGTTGSTTATADRPAATADRPADAAAQGGAHGSATGPVGAELASADEVYARAAVIAKVGPPSPQESDRLRRGQVLVGLLRPWERPAEVLRWAQRHVTAIALDYLPRTLSRAQTMDALSSQSSIAGYRAAIRAADTYGGYFPMLMTAAGTVKPADVLVLGAGVAGLQAIATARRLGASVSGYDVRPQARAEVASLGARFVDLPGVVSTAGSDGYARELTAQEQAAQLAALDRHIARADVVITTAQVPGRKPPLLVTASAVAAMKPGSVVVDIAAGPYGGNVEVSQADRTVTVPPGVIVIGAGNLPSDMAPAASRAYARNMVALLGQVIRDGAVTIDPDDEVVGAMLVTHGGAVVHPAAIQAVDRYSGKRVAP